MRKLALSILSIFLLSLPSFSAGPAAYQAFRDFAYLDWRVELTEEILSLLNVTMEPLYFSSSRVYRCDVVAKSYCIGLEKDIVFKNAVVVQFVATFKITSHYVSGAADTLTKSFQKDETYRLEDHVNITDKNGKKQPRRIAPEGKKAILLSKVVTVYYVRSTTGWVYYDADVFKGKIDKKMKTKPFIQEEWDKSGK